MKKSILNLGKALSKNEQRKINGGAHPTVKAGDAIVYCLYSDGSGGVVGYPSEESVYNDMIASCQANGGTAAVNGNQFNTGQLPVVY